MEWYMIGLWAMLLLYIAGIFINIYEASKGEHTKTVNPGHEAFGAAAHVVWVVVLWKVIQLLS